MYAFPSSSSPSNNSRSSVVSSSRAVTRRGRGHNSHQRSPPHQDSPPHHPPSLLELSLPHHPPRLAELSPAHRPPRPSVHPRPNRPPRPSAHSLPHRPPRPSRPPRTRQVEQIHHHHTNVVYVPVPMYPPWMGGPTYTSHQMMQIGGFRNLPTSAEVMGYHQPAQIRLEAPGDRPSTTSPVESRNGSPRQQINNENSDELDLIEPRVNWSKLDSEDTDSSSNSSVSPSSEQSSSSIYVLPGYQSGLCHYSYHQTRTYETRVIRIDDYIRKPLRKSKLEPLPEVSTPPQILSPEPEPEPEPEVLAPGERKKPPVAQWPKRDKDCRVREDRSISFRKNATWSGKSANGGLLLWDLWFERIDVPAAIQLLRMSNPKVISFLISRLVKEYPYGTNDEKLQKTAEVYGYLILCVPLQPRELSCLITQIVCSARDKDNGHCRKFGQAALQICGIKIKEEMEKNLEVIDFSPPTTILSEEEIDFFLAAPTKEQIRYKEEWIKDFFPKLYRQQPNEKDKKRYEIEHVKRLWKNIAKPKVVNRRNQRNF